MPSQWDKLEAALRSPFEVPVYYFGSTEDALLRQAMAQVRGALAAAGEDAETTRVDGPVPDIGAVIAAAGTISFFGTPRVVEVAGISPSAMSDKDIAELADLFGQLENAVLVVTALYKDKKGATSKKAKKLLDTAGQAGFAAQLEKPTRRENVDYLEKQARQAGAAFAPGAAVQLLEQAGEDRDLLASETEKLAAMSGYGEITGKMVQRYGAKTIEADVFSLARSITARREGEAFAKLADLLALRHEPIAIAGALAGTYVDMYRVRAGMDAGKNIKAIFTELGYKGSDWRLQKAKESAARYSMEGLQRCVLCLSKLDRDLKSSALADKGILLQAAVSELILLSARR